jgi:hypothetical protein
MDATKSVVITKLGGEPTPISTGGKKVKTMKTFPRGVLKKTQKSGSKLLVIKPVFDPAKPPPTKKNMRKHTIRLVTDKGESHRRKTIKNKISKMSNKEVDHLVVEHKLLKNPKTPMFLKREMLKGAMLAGFISS